MGTKGKLALPKQPPGAESDLALAAKTNDDDD
jgi:hypothetical protein